jgi:hypothetical protein
MDSPIFLCLPDCWLDVSMYPECTVAGHIDAGSLGFPCVKANVNCITTIFVICTLRQV